MVDVIVARREPARELYVEEILESGRRYAVAGYVVDFDPHKGEGKIDDGSGVLRVVLENFIFAEELDVGRFVRVIGKVYLSSEGKVMRVELAHRLGVSPKLYKEIKELERRVLT